MAASVWMKFSITVDAVSIMPAQSADDAHRHGLPNAEGIADGEDHVADFQLVAVGERDGRQIVRINFQNRHVGLRIGADDFGDIFLFVVVGDGDFDFIRAIHDVVGRQNVAVG